MARNVTVTLDDGSTHVYQNVPDDATPQQVQARASQDFAGRSITALDGGRSATAAPVSPQHDAIAARVNNDQISQDAKNGPSFMGEAAGQIGNLIAGGVRGAGSIGATLIYPFDKAQDLYHGDRNQSLSGLVLNKAAPLSRNDERRQEMDQALANLGDNPISKALGVGGADINSPAFKVGKVGAEIAGTAGTGGLIANGLTRAAPVVGEVAPNLLQAIRTSGMSANAAAAQAPLVASGAGNLLTRVGGGAITGGASAGLVDPSQAGNGASIGGVLPVAVRGLGAAGNAAGNLLRGAQQSPEAAAAIQAARGAGYVIPPTQANPSLLNRFIEGFSGKLTTAQNASARNATTTNRLAAETIGLPGETTLTPGVLNDVRREAGQAYTALNGAGVITPGPAYTQALDRITAQARTAAAGFPNAPANPLIARIDSLRSPQFDASAAVAQTRELREAADTAAGSGDAGLARSLRAGSDALEDAIAAHLQQTGQADLLANFQAARQRIAQTYSIQDALNAETGTVNAKKLAAQLQKDKPLSGGLEQAARFAARFPKAAQTPEVMGSLPGASPLDFAAAGGMTAASGNPLAMASVLARPATRALALSPVIQNRLIQRQGTNSLQALIDANPDLSTLGYQAAPNALADR